MRSEEQFREELLKQELAKIFKHNPNAVPLYIIVNSLNSSECVQQPLTLCSKELPVKDFVQNIRKKYSKFPYIYFFGKESKPRNLQGKNNKQKGSIPQTEERQKFIEIDERLQSKILEQIHKKYKDSNGLLVIVVSQTQMVKPKTKPMYQTIFYVLALVFAAAFIFLTFSEQQPAVVRRESQLDYIV